MRSTPGYAHPPFAAACRLLLALALALLAGCDRHATTPPAAPPATAMVPRSSAPSSTTTTASTTPTSPAGATPAGNHVSPAPVAYVAGTDYFPAKVTVDAAAYFSVSYHGSYKVVTVRKPWRGAARDLTYLLVQRGTPVPKDVPADLTLTVPVQRLVTLANPFLPQVALLGLEPQLVGHAKTAWITTPSIIARVTAGQVEDVGGEGAWQVERLLALQPDVVLANALGDANDAQVLLGQRGLPVVVEADYLETTPLGRAEWVKFLALLTNREAQAQAQFAAMAARYAALTANAQQAAHRPTVLLGAPFHGTWFMSGGHSYMARLLADAGAAYLWADDDSTGGIPLDLERVYAKAGNAELWLNCGTFPTLAAAAAEEERLRLFAAARSGQVYAPIGQVTPGGGNDYWEGAIAAPDQLLADLIRICHPEQLPDHPLRWYRRLQ